MSVTTTTSNKPAPTKNKPTLNVICLYLLTILAILYTAYFAQNLILLLLVAGLISLLLSPGESIRAAIHPTRAWSDYSSELFNRANVDIDSTIARTCHKVG